MPSIYDSMAFHVLDTISVGGLGWGYVDHTWRGEYDVLVEEGYLDLDPTGTIFRLTDSGSWHCENLQQGWQDDCINWQDHVPVRMSKRAYARHRGCNESTVRRACRGRLAFAVEDGMIDRDIADALWVCTRRRVKTLPKDRRQVSEHSYWINHDRPRDPDCREEQRIRWGQIAANT